MKVRLVLDLALLVLYVIAMNTSATGIPVHEWLSVFVAGVVVVHLLTEWDWTLHVLKRFFRRLIGLPRLNLALDVLLFVSFTLVMLSGFMVSESIAPLLNISLPFGPTWRIVHSLSADVALVVLGVHMGLHWRWFLNAFKRLSRPSIVPDAAD